MGEKNTQSGASKEQLKEKIDENTPIEFDIDPDELDWDVSDDETYELSQVELRLHWVYRACDA